MEQEGWAILMDSIERRLRHEQKTLMKSQIRPEENYDRVIGQWAGMERVEQIAKGIVAAGEEAKAELERRGA